MASGIASTTRLAGMLIGVAGLGAVIAAHQPHSSSGGGKAIDAHSFVTGFSAASLAAAVVSALAAFLAWRYVAGATPENEKNPETKTCLPIDCRHPL
jgi:hypothetical protein